jgi:uncharacterized protein (DUF58 family)
MASSSRSSWFPVLTGRLVTVAAVLSAVMLLIPLGVGPSLLLANGFVLVVWLLDALLAPKPSSIVVEREFPEIVPLHTEAQLQWTVRNSAARRRRVMFADQLPRSFRATRRGASVVLPADGRAFVTAGIRPQRRGRHEIGRLVVRTFGPLHLGGRQGRRDVPVVVRVYPSFTSRREAELRIEKARILEVGLRSVRGHGGGTEFEQLREYTVDDDFRRIDWAATVRTSKPIVRTYRAERNQNVVCLLDCGRVMAGRVANVPRLEHAMDAVMALSTVAARLGDRVGLLAFDTAIAAEVPARSGNPQIARVTEAMYQLEPKLQESDYQGAFVQLLSRFRRRSLVVLFTELSESAVNEEIAPALALLARRHLVVVASVSDPDVTSWARALPEEGNKAYRKAAAMVSMGRRRRTAALLRARGITVVDAVPGTLAARVADAYLDAKATGSL